MKHQIKFEPDETMDDRVKKIEDTMELFQQKDVSLVQLRKRGYADVDYSGPNEELALADCCIITYSK